MINNISNKIKRLDKHTLEVFRKSISSSIVKVSGMIISLFVSISIGRLLGPDGLGIINLSNRIINILVIVGLFGIRELIIKEVAIARNNNNKEHIANVMYTSFWINCVLTSLLSIFLIFSAPFIANKFFNEPRLTYPLIIALLALTPQVISRILSGALIGYGKIWQSNLVQQSLSMLITAILLMFLWIFNYLITINVIASIYAIGRISVTLIIALYWRRLNPKLSIKKKFIHKKFFPSAYSLFLVSGASTIILNLDVLVLGFIENSEEIGLYTAASSVALLTGFFLQITNSAIAPKIASLYRDERIIELSSMLQKVTRALFVIGLGTLIFFIFFGNDILSLWGDEFKKGYMILVILGVGQFINISTGAVGLILIMTGFEKISAKISISSTALNIFLLVIFTINWGAIGTALATALTVAIQNIIIAIYVKIKTGLSPISLNFKKLKYKE